MDAQAGGRGVPGGWRVSPDAAHPGKAASGAVESKDRLELAWANSLAENKGASAEVLMRDVRIVLTLAE
jgi:hypothetical protein